MKYIIIILLLTSSVLAFTDVGRIYEADIKQIQTLEQEQELIQAVKTAYENNYTISIAGKQHSQGGHTFADGSLILDMTNFTQILKLENNTITVQSGATWKDIQEYINPYNLSVKVMQSSNIFSIGGSLSSNIHGRDIRYGPLIETVQSMRVLLANGTIVNTSRTENEELFKLIQGGYGLFGIILDATIELTNNSIYEKSTKVMSINEYENYFIENVLPNKSINLHYARLSIAKKTYFKELYAVNYAKINNTDFYELQPEENIKRDKFFMDLSRKHDWAKSLRWFLQSWLIDNPSKTEILSRNNAMSPPISFLEHKSEKDTDILQEYFIPVGKLDEFITEAKEIYQNNNVNVLSVTIRYLPKNTESFLSYSTQDTFAIVFLTNIELNEKGIDSARTWTQKLVNTTIELNGTYYLTYQLFPTQEQIRNVYPHIDQFFEQKKVYDPDELFTNRFYQTYSRIS